MEGETLTKSVNLTTFQKSRHGEYYGDLNIFEIERLIKGGVPVTAIQGANEDNIYRVYVKS